MSLIGITGRKYNGKDTVAEHLVRKYGFVQLTYAEPLKEICKTLFGFSHRQLHGDLKETIDTHWGISPRNALQFLGTDIFRHKINELMPEIEDNFWVKCLMARVNKLKEENPNVRICISDVRFPNEVDVLKQINSNIIRVVRPSINDSDCHESEKLISTLEVTHELLNDSTLEQLYNEIDVIMNELNITPIHISSSKSVMLSQ